jgi:predicted NAD/FAD-binding protein
MDKHPRKKICIIGAGAAGLASAWSLCRSQGFAVTVYEKNEHLGGVATTLPIMTSAVDKIWINDQVQGGAPIYRNTKHLFEAVGFDFVSITLKVSVGTGQAHWNNAQTTPFIERMQPQIKKFQRVLSFIHRHPKLFFAIPIEWVLRGCRFSEEFRFYGLYPLMSLFFASGIDSMRVPALIVAQIFLNEDSKLFDFDAGKLLAPAPEMIAFPNLTEIYTRIAESLGDAVHTGSAVTSVIRHKDKVEITCGSKTSEMFDAVIFACSAENVLKMLADSSPFERFVLGGVEYCESVVVTHTDEAYLQQYYTYKSSEGIQYYTRNDPQNTERLEISFDLREYQPSLKETGLKVFQTIDPIGKINPDKILYTRVPRHPINGVKHFTRVVPILRFIQKRRNAFFAGAYTLFNIHEIAIVSGFVAAQHLGAPFPFKDDPLALRQFQIYNKIVYG